MKEVFVSFFILALLFAGITAKANDEIRLYFYGSICLTFFSIAMLVASKQALELGATISYFITLFLATIPMVLATFSLYYFFKEARKAQKKDLV